MKKVFLISIASFLITVTARAEFYTCEGFANIEEYRVGINLKSNRAGFFDNDSISYMKLSHVQGVGAPAQKIMIFKGEDASYAGNIEMRFNYTLKTAELYSVEPTGRVVTIGKAPCAVGEPWDDLD